MAAAVDTHAPMAAKTLSVESRIPPQDLDAEAAVLSVIMVDPPRFDEVADVLRRPDYFSSESHRQIYEAAVAVSARGGTTDVLQVCAELRSRERIAQVGGVAYVTQLLNQAPSLPSVREYAEIVRGKWIARQVILASQRAVAIGYTDYGTAEEYLDAASEALYALANEHTPTTTSTLSEVLAINMKAMAEAARRGAGITGLSTGFERYDRITAGLHDGELTILAARPGMGKTSLALNMASNMAFLEEGGERNNAVAFISIEMPKEPIVNRWLCSEAQVDSARLRTGMLTPADWTKITKAAVALSDLAVWIDDASGPTLMDLRSKVRRIEAEARKKKKRLRAVFVDYLQLMKSSNRVYSREQEVSEISRGLKQLAKDLRIPVVALSQLNRESEKRTKTGHRPQLSDLRECIAGSETMFDALTGDMVAMRDIAAGRQVVAYGLGHDLKVRAAPVSLAWSTGVKPVLKITTETGRTLRCTANHPIRLLGGWAEASRIHVGQRIAVPRETAGPLAPENTMSDDELRLLGYLVIHGQIGPSKVVPDAVLRCDNRKLAIFLGALWAGNGSVVPRKSGGWSLKFTSTSMGLLKQVHWMLTRLGVVGCLGGRERNSKSKVDISTISVSESDAILRFASLVTIPGVKGERLAEAVAWCNTSGRNAHVDRMPLAVTEQVADLRLASGMSWRALGYRCQGKEMCRSDLARAAARLGSPELTQLSDSDVLWDTLVSIEPDGEEETFDLRVPGLGNFVVGNIFAHNSGAIEQDADNIVFIHREDYYDKDTADRNIAELIVAKQRNGATDTVRVRFDAQYTRFDNLSETEYDDASESRFP